MLLSMQRGILYGPVNSRRYGKSLGINLMPGHDKLCPFNCVYCHYGITKRCTADVSRFVAELPHAAEVIQAVERAMKSDTAFDLVTFSGNGEPTFHPDFPIIAREVKKLRDKLRPKAKLALLSNSAGVVWDSIREVLPLFDLPVMKLDAGTRELFHAINRPAPGVLYDDIMDGLKNLKGIIVQTVFVDGEPSNTGAGDVRAWQGRIAEIHPREVHIYSIDRPVPQTGIALVPPLRLGQIAAETEHDTGVLVKAFGV